MDFDYYDTQSYDDYFLETESLAAYLMDVSCYEDYFVDFEQ